MDEKFNKIFQAIITFYDDSFMAFTSFIEKK